MTSGPVRRFMLMTLLSAPAPAAVQEVEPSTYGFSVGFSFQFGSIYNNVVNNLFDGARGGGFRRR
jgi:hypothetical protein